MKKIKVVILTNEIVDDHILWINACEEYKEKIEYSLVELTGNSWLKDIQSISFDILLGKPGGYTSLYKNLYDERIYILNKVLNYPVFPSADEIFFYENKRYLSYWLEANKVPHPRTEIFYKKAEAIEFLSKQKLPIVAKSNIGASGRGVFILKSSKEAFKYINQAFSSRGAPKSIGPKLSKEGLLRRSLYYLKDPHALNLKLNLYKSLNDDRQKGFVIFQEFISHDFEWRVVRIGESYFAHKKLKVKDKASGSLLKEYTNPPVELLDFVKQITDSHKLFSQAVDIFEFEGRYLVNEMQCIFGQSDPYQMLVNGNQGRYLKKNDEWVFEPGDYNRNECYSLRIEFIIDRLSVVL